MSLRQEVWGLPLGVVIGVIGAGCRGGTTSPPDAPVVAPVGAPGASDGAASGGPTVMPATDGGVAALADGAVVRTCGPLADGGPGLAEGPSRPSAPNAKMSFFVSSQKNATGNLGGLAAADARCQKLAVAVGAGHKIWHAYLSVEHDASKGKRPTNARDRIGKGPWYNARGVLVAADLTELHGRGGDAAVFLDENGMMINGQWTGSPTPNEHDILTGSNADGTLAVGRTCGDWTSSQAAADGGVPDGGELSMARVGHSDGFGPHCSTATTPNNMPSWNSAHNNAGCDQTAPRGGAGRIYCFAIK